MVLVNKLRFQLYFIFESPCVKNWVFYSKIFRLINHTGYFECIWFSFYVTLVEKIKLLGIFSLIAYTNLGNVSETSRKICKRLLENIKKIKVYCGFLYTYIYKIYLFCRIPVPNLVDSWASLLILLKDSIQLSLPAPGQFLILG